MARPDQEGAAPSRDLVSAHPDAVLAHRVGEHRHEPSQLVLRADRRVVHGDAESGALLAVVDVAVDELARVFAAFIANHDPRTFWRCSHGPSGIRSVPLGTRAVYNTAGSALRGMAPSGVKFGRPNRSSSGND